MHRTGVQTREVYDPIGDGVARGVRSLRNRLRAAIVIGRSELSKLPLRSQRTTEKKAGEALVYLTADAVRKFFRSHVIIDVSRNARTSMKAGLAPDCSLENVDRE